MHNQQKKSKHFIAQIDEENRIIHFSATSELHINSIRKMVYMFKRMYSEFEKLNNNKKWYLVVDFNKIIFDINFSKHIVPLLEKMTQDFLYSDGAVAYGISISRLTLKMTYQEIKDNEKIFFNTKEEAFAHIDKQRQNKRFDFGQGKLKRVPIQLDNIEITPPANTPKRQKVSS